MKKTDYTLYGLFDLLKPNMNFDEVKHFINYMVNLKLVEDGMHRKVKYAPVIIGRRKGRLAFTDIDDDETFDDPFISNNKIYLPEDVVTYAISGNHMGRLMSYTGHELEHLYQMFKRINDRVNYEDFSKFIFPENFLEEMNRTMGEENSKFVKCFAEQVSYLCNVKLYAVSRIEFEANAMATVYYGFNLYQYAKLEPDETRRNFLFDQVKEILEEQCIMIELNGLNTKNVKHHIDETLYVGFLDVLKLGYDSRDYKFLIKELCFMGKVLELDKDFMKTFRSLAHEKYGKIHISQRGRLESIENANKLIDEYTGKVILDSHSKIASRMGEPPVRWQAELDAETETKISEQVEEIFNSLDCN